MTKFAVFALAASALSLADAGTRVSVIELGSSGVVRRTNACDPLTSVSGVASFWSALHSPGRKLQHAGMTVVPDLFNKASEGLVVGLKGSGMDLDTMPFINSLMTEEGSNGVVGHMEVNGNSCDAMMKKVGNVESVEASSLAASARNSATSPGLTGMMTTVDASSSASVDSQISDLIKALDHGASAEGKTIVLHLVVEEEEGSARRRKLSRRLEEADGEEGGEEGEGEQQQEQEGQQQEDQEGEEEGEGEGNNNNNNNNANANGQGQQNNGYYGYGYYNSYGEWVRLSLCLRFLLPTKSPFAKLFSRYNQTINTIRLPPTKRCSKSNTSTLYCGPLSA